MHLKTLTLKGFKSFASSTTLHLEKGVTCVVGPNGSGKSNVVDALAWVMGEQGAKSLRGGKMEDVIFSGTSGRAPLGRAEVSLTIDNSDGLLPIDYTEVTIARTLFRNGGSEYSINGESVRLLDVQELLSDSGIGREMHVIVGQNRLTAILEATPEDRRGIIEEAAGVLKHRKRKEKALRKLDAMQTNLTRLQDLTNELRRQLKPLGRQAEVQWVDHWAQRLGIPVVTAGMAVVQALQHMGAQRLALASPYPSALTQASVAYWQSHGFEVLQVQNVTTTSEGFHAIYTTGADAAAQAVQGLRSKGADAVLMLGTGMPSLQAISAHGKGDGPPVLSSMLALVWQATSAVQPQYRDIAPWLSGALWAARAQAMGLWQSP